jgi:hypothetical protein
MHSFSPPFMLHVLPSHPPWLDHSNYTTYIIYNIILYIIYDGKTSIHMYNCVSSKVQQWKKKKKQ